MTKLNEIHKCVVCGNMVEVINIGGGKLVCCDQPMELLIEKTEDRGKEKHVPVIEKIEGGIKVEIGSVPHPMEEKHFIQWIEVLVDGRSYHKYLKHDDAPSAKFCIQGDEITVREYCNLHGLWTSLS